MTTIKITDSERSHTISVDVTIETVNKVITDALLIYDKDLLLKSLSKSLKDYLIGTFSISAKEISNYFNYHHEMQMFVEAMKRHGYFIKYHTAYKITEDLRNILIASEPDKDKIFGIDEGLLFDKLLGLDLIKYLKNSKNFQKSDFFNMSELPKRKANKVLDYMIFEGFLSKNGTTYCITSKFTNKIKQYAELLEEK